jgi:hypothetical protein
LVAFFFKPRALVAARKVFGSDFKSLFELFDDRDPFSADSGDSVRFAGGLQLLTKVPSSSISGNPKNFWQIISKKLKSAFLIFGAK